MVSFKENHLKHMGTVIAVLAVIKEGDDFSALPLDPALILKSKSNFETPRSACEHKPHMCDQCQLHEGSFCTLFEMSIGQNEC